MSATIPPEVQAALQQVEDDIDGANQADVDNDQATADLLMAQNKSDLAYDAAIAAHQKVTEDVQTLIDKINSQMGGGSKSSPTPAASPSPK